MKSKKSSIPVYSHESLRSLPIISEELRFHLYEFEKWLRVFGFARSTAYYSPAYVRSFFHYLERSKLKSIQQVTNNQIRLYMSHMAVIISSRTKRKLSQSYLLNHINAIKLFGKYLIKSSGIIMDTCFRYSRGLTGERRWIKQFEIERLYERCNPGYSGSLNKVILGIYYGLGLRRMEGIGIDVSDIQWTNGVIYIKIAKNRRDRFVPMSPKVQYDIKSYMEKYRIQLLIEKGRPMEKALLVSEKGTRITGNSVYSRLQNLAHKADIPIPLPLHSLRHSIATHLLGNGLELERIGQFLGHKSLESTQIYAHLIHKTD